MPIFEWTKKHVHNDTHTNTHIQTNLHLYIIYTYQMKLQLRKKQTYQFLDQLQILLPKPFHLTLVAIEFLKTNKTNLNNLCY